MTETGFNTRDREQIKSLRLTPEQVKNQVELFKKGTAPVTLVRPATIDDGIKSFNEREKEKSARSFDSLLHHLKVIKFIPSSGAATRMFQVPLNFLNHPKKITRYLHRSKNAGLEGEDLFLSEFLAGLREGKFAFHDDLQSVLVDDKMEIQTLLNQGKIKTILKYLLTPSGLNYANLPKALLKFHQYPDHSRTPFEEHMVEVTGYLKNQSGYMRLHYTISPELKRRFRVHRDSLLKKYDKSGDRYRISFSVQPPHTSTIAVDHANEPIRNGEGRLVFRPGGHGALIENLNRINADFVFITNIDNVAPDHLKNEAVFHRKVLGGYLGDIQEKTFHHLKRLSNTQCRQKEIEEIRGFCEQKLMIEIPEQFQKWSPAEKQNFIFKALNRPIRVCGMVKNLGEPGGGPFWIRDKNGRMSLQIIESSQIQKTKSQTAIFSESTHFNPVDMVCGIKNYLRKKFNLLDFVDSESYFVAKKSSQGKPLKALELPGLWNGAMAKWITIFVDIPVGAFFPVKTVNDLLREAHQPENHSRKRK